MLTMSRLKHWQSNGKRPYAIIGRKIVMLWCGPLKPTFAAIAKAKRFGSPYAHP
jgi:hypothetical protein